MTDRQIYDLLRKIDHGYNATFAQKRRLAVVKQLSWSGISILPNCMELLSSLTKLELSNNTNLYVISSLSKLTWLKSLNLSGNHNINDISALSGLTSMEKLDLSFTSVKDITALEGLTKLTYLDLSRNGNLRNISSLSRLTSLYSLDLHYTSIRDIDSLSGLRNLIYLDLSNTYVSDISALFGMTKIEHLALCSTDISVIYTLSTLTGLTHLDLSGNNSIYNINALSGLTRLSYLDLRNNRVINIDGIAKLTDLVYLDLSGNRSVNDISELSELRRLIYLNLSNTTVNDISALSELKRIEFLSLRATGVSDISALNSLTALTHLDLRATKVKDVYALSKLTNLAYLNLRATGVRNITSLAELTELIHLNLSYTEVNDISVLSGMTKLTHLYLKKLVISQIPESLVDLGIDFVFDEISDRGKSGIYIHGLTLTDQPIEIFCRGRKAILEYFKTEKPGTSPINECKVVFLGDGGAGKTLIIDRLMNDGKQSENFTGESTPGVYISSKEYIIDGESIELHFWDFGGQEIMHSMHRLFLTNRTLYVVVANARDNKANGQAWYWVRNIKSFANGAPILLVINQKDQYPGVSVNQNGLEKEYPYLREVKIISALYDDPSCFNNEIRDAICRIVSGMDSVHTPFVRTWLMLMNNLQDMKDDVITSDAFYTMCRNNGIETSRDILDVIINWYQDLGVCFYSRKHPASGQYMVLKPRWLLNALYILVFNGRLLATNGIISEDSVYKLICESDADMEIRKVWEDITYETFQVQYIINVLLNFELIFRLEKSRYKGNVHFFIPMLCDENEPIGVSDYENDDNVFHISFRYSYLPENILHRLMVRHGDEIDLGMVWRKGAAFERKNCKWNALVYIKDNNLEIFVKAGNQDIHPANTYLEMFRESIYEINGIYGLTANEFISFRYYGVEDAFNYKFLMGTKENKGSEVYSTVFERMIPIDEILGIVRKPQNAMTSEVIELILSALADISKRCVDFVDKGEEEITRDVEAAIKQVLNDKYQIQIAREYTIGRANKKMGETDLYFYRQQDGRTENLYILENKNMHIFDFKKQYEQLIGYLNPDFIAGITLSINKKLGWEEAFDKVENVLQKLKSEKDKFAPIMINRKFGEMRTIYLKSAHIVPETGRIMNMYHLVLQISDEDRQKVAQKARKNRENS